MTKENIEVEPVATRLDLANNDDTTRVDPSSTTRMAEHTRKILEQVTSEWSPLEPMLAVAMGCVAPGKAFRKYQQRSTGPQMSQSEAIASGQRTYAMSGVASLRKRHIETEQRDDGLWVRRKSQADIDGKVPNNDGLILAVAIGEFRSKENLHFQPTEKTWAGFCDEPIRKTRDKHKVMSYVLGTLVPMAGQKHKDGPCDSELPHRNGATVVKRSGITLDADFLARDGDEDGERMRKLVADTGLEALVHDTFSSKPGDTRYRLVFPLAASVPSCDYGRIARVLMTWLGWDGTVTIDTDGEGKQVRRFGPFDPGSEQYTRFMYAQATAIGEGYRERFRGRLLDPDDLALEDDPKPRKEASGEAAPPPGTDVPPEVAQIAMEALQRCAAEVAGAGEHSRNNTLFSKSAWMLDYAAGGALDWDEVVEVMTKAGLATGLDEEEVCRTVENAGNAAVPRWPEFTTAAEAFGELDLDEDDDDPACPHMGCEAGRPFRMDMDGNQLPDRLPTCLRHLKAHNETKGEPSTWKRQDVASMLARMAAGEVTKPVPTVAQMGADESQCLLYPGRVNTVFGESGAGKTWLVLLACLQEMRKGNPVVFIDFEDDLSSALLRLRSIGATDAELNGFFHYIAPEEKLGGRRKKLVKTLDALKPTLVVIDSTGESIAIEGLNPSVDDDVAKWIRVLPKACTPSGAAVVVIDHVPKAEDNKGAPIGSHRKKAASWAVFKVDTEKPFSRDVAGSVRVIATKDKAGNFRQGDTVARLVVNPGGNNKLDLSLVPVASKVDAKWDENLLVKISTGLEKAMAESADDEWPGASRAYIEGKEFVTGYARSKVRRHLDHLVTLGHVHREKKGQTDLHTPKSQYVPSAVFSDE